MRYVHGAAQAAFIANTWQYFRTAVDGVEEDNNNDERHCYHHPDLV